MSLLHFISIISAFLMAFILTPVVSLIAKKINLIDQPNYRKIHAKPVPLVGGIIIFISTTITMGLLIQFDVNLFSYLNVYFILFTLLIMGVIDDRFDLKASLKLLVQILLSHLIIMQGIKIESLYGLFGIYRISFEFQYVLTLIVISGVVNAFNLMDGIDGLAAGIALLGFIVFTFIAILTKQQTLSLIFCAYIGGLLAFLKYNFSKKNKIFMGDAGSLSIGFLLVVSGIYMIQNSQNTSNISFVAVGVISVLILPVFDALRVFRKRIKSSKSPFKADKTHLHHLVLETGLKHKASALGIVSIMFFLIIIGYISFKFINFSSAVVLMLLFLYVISMIFQFNNKINYWKKHIKSNEI